MECDGVVECSSQEDELFCGPVPANFSCHHGAEIAWSRVCDGEVDCEFAEEERNCRSGQGAFGE
jgi:hypothetical protein